MFKVVLTLDCQINQLPKKADEELRDLWAINELGNDTEHYRWNWEDNYEGCDVEKYPNLAKFLEKQLEKEGLDKSYELLLHWWW